MSIQYIADVEFSILSVPVEATEVTKKKLGILGQFLSKICNISCVAFNTMNIKARDGYGPDAPKLKLCEYFALRANG